MPLRIPRIGRTVSIAVSGAIVAIVFTSATVPGAAAAQAQARSGTGRIEKVVAAQDRLAVLAGPSIALFDDEGRLLGRCGAFSVAAARPEHEPIGKLDADEALAAAGLSDDDDSSDAEDALEEEGLGRHEKRRAGTGASPLPRDLAAGTADDAIWIATSDGLYRESGGACLKTALPGRDLILASAAGDTVAAATETLLWRFDVSTSAAVVAGGLPMRPRALAVGEGGRILVADDDGVLEVRAGAEPVRLLDRPAETLASCDGMLLALADDGVYVEQAGTFGRVADRPPIRTVACGSPAGPRFIGAGIGVWTTTDGAAWTEHPGALGRSVTAAAALGDRVWVAVEGSLTMLDDTVPPVVESIATAAGAVGLALGVPRVPSLVHWPRLTVALAAEQTSLRTGWSVFVLLTFPLGRKTGAGPGPAELGAELLRRDAALAAEQISLSGDASDDEAVASARALEQERTALR